MLILDSIRGKDSTGAFTVYQNYQSYLVKQATHPHLLFENKDWDKFVEKASKSGILAIGHNRKATVGDISSKNAHPFHEENIILVHNGGISNWKSLDDTANVDSQAVARALNKTPAIELLKKLYGAYAFIWYDKREKAIFCARNSQRPLWIGETHSSWLLASEPWMFTVPFARASTKINEYKQFSEEVLYKFDLRTRKWSEQDYKTPVKTYGGVEFDDDYYYNRYGTGYGHRNNEKTTQPKITPPSTAVSTVVQKASAGAEAAVTIGFKRDDYVTHTIDRVERDTATGRIRIYGKVVDSDKEAADIVSLTQYTDKEEAIKHFLGKYNFFYSKISQVTQPVCGTALWVNDTKYFEKSMEDFDGTDWAASIVTSVLMGKKCSRCKKDTSTADLPFSRITKQVDAAGYNRYTAICPDCVEKTLPKDQQHAFTEAYITSLQDRQPVGQKTGETMQ